MNSCLTKSQSVRIKVTMEEVLYAKQLLTTANMTTMDTCKLFKF